MAPTRFHNRYFIVVFLVSLTMLSAEVTVTRLLSYKFYFHFVFLVISLAQLGIAGAGAWVFALEERGENRKLFLWGLIGIALFALLFLLGYAWLSPRPNVGMAKINGAKAVPYLLALALLLVALYFSAGVVYSALFSRYKSRFNQLYAADLVGAAAGCVASVGLMWLFGPVRTLVASALLAVLAALLVPAPSQPLRRAARVSGLALLAIGVLVAWSNPQLFDPNARHPVAGITAHAWNHLARTDRVGPGHYNIDGDASTWVIDPQSDVEYTVTVPNPRVAIIGVGAGPQLKTALEHTGNTILAIDINPDIIAWSVGEDAAYNGNIFNWPQVIAAVDEGRHAIRSSAEPFDLIVMHAVDTYAASSAGAYSLSENYLYTVEAFADFSSRLTPQGVIAIRRWLFYPPRENLRLFTTIYQFLTTAGAANPADHIIVLAPVEDYRRPDLKEWGYILFSRQPFTEEQLTRVDAYVAAHHWSYLHRPGTDLDTPFSEFATSSDHAQFYRDYPYFVKPCTDANPFFFQFVPPFASLYAEATATRSVVYNQSSDLLFITLPVLILLVILLLALPLYLRRGTFRPGPGLTASTLYFASLGVGFMAVELASIQVLTLFLGHPTYALSVALLGMLLFAGVGSALVQRFPTERVKGIGLLIAALAVFAALGLLPLVHRLISAPFWARVALTLVYLALVGIPMGMPMATGIRLIGPENKPQVAWAWACNGGAAVVGTNLCMILMVYFGMPIVFLVGAGCYLLAFIMLTRMRTVGAW